MINRYKLMMVLILSILFGCTKRETTITSKTDEQFFNEKLEALARSKQPFVVPITELAPFEWDAVCQVTPYAIDLHPIQSQYPFLKDTFNYQEYVAIFEGYGFLFLTKQTQKITFINKTLNFETDRTLLKQDKLSVQNEFLSKNLDEICFSRQDDLVLQSVKSKSDSAVRYLILLKKGR